MFDAVHREGYRLWFHLQMSRDLATQRKVQIAEALTAAWLGREVRQLAEVLLPPWPSNMKLNVKNSKFDDKTVSSQMATPLRAIF